MTKSIPKSSHQDKREKLLSLIEGNKMSLVKAAQQLGIPYVDAKQMLFIFGTPRSKKLHLARSPFDPSKSAAQDFRRARIAEKGQEILQSDEKRERKEKLRR